MELLEAEIIQKSGSKSGNCNQNIVLLYEYESACVANGYKVIKRKHKLSIN